MKKILKNFINNFFLLISSNRFVMKYLLIIDSYLYKIISRSSVKINSGKHPKHFIINYQNWFTNNIKEKSNVIDIGCSHGHLTSHIASKAKNVLGIEINKKDLELAKTINSKKNILYLNADATKLDYSIYDKYEYIVLSNVLEHIKDRTKFLSNLLSSFQNGINVLIRVPSIERDWLAVYKKNNLIDYRLDSTHYIEYTKVQLFNELHDAGLKIISCEMNFGEFYVVSKKE